MSESVWAEGFVPPKGVTPQQANSCFSQMRDAGIDPSPTNVIDAAQADGHLFHEYFWGKDSTKHWAHVGREYGARKLVAAVHNIIVKGNRRISFRAVEVIKIEGKRRWMMTDDILSDEDYADILLVDMIRQLEQITAKMARWRELLSEPQQDAAE